MSAPYKIDERSARGGWAPGGYIRTCTVCHDHFVGDKRAWVCADCAYKEPAADASSRTVYKTMLRHCDKCEPSFFCWGMSEPSLCANKAAVELLSDLSDAQLQAKIDTPDDEEKVAIKIMALMEGRSGMSFNQSAQDKVLGIVNEYSVLMRERIGDLEFEVRDLKAGRDSACATIAAMHEAATGVKGAGLKRGVVEDVEDVRLRAEKAEAEVMRLGTCFGDTHNELITALARVKQLEARLKQLEGHSDL